MADPTLLASPPAPAPAATEPAKPAAAAPAPAAEPAKTVLGTEPAKPAQEPTAADKLYGKLVEKVVADGEKKSATEPAKPEAKPAEAAKPQEAKPADGSAKPAAEQKPIDLKAPDGSLLDPADVEKVASLAKEANLTPEVAQKVVEAQSRAVTSYKERLLAQNAGQSKQWVEDLKADKEFGGEKFNESVELAKRGFHAYAGPELIRLMNDTGWGNHPEVVKTFARIGKTLQEGRFVTGGQPVATPKTAADVLYGKTMGKK